MQKEVLKKWVRRLKEEADKSGVKVKRFCEAYPLKEDKAIIEYMKDWVWMVNELLKNKGEENIEDIRQYFLRKK